MTPPASPALRIGTSGYAYPAWRGAFYPKKLKAAEFLTYYAQHFDTVEINNTFYRMPKSDMLALWQEQTPAAFSFVLKAPQRITHHARLKETAFSTTDHFLDVAKTLGKKLGPVFFQLPPNMKQDIPRLQAFFERQPRGIRAAIEFRHPSWHDDAVHEVLQAHRVALCIADTEEETTPKVATADFGYLRLRRADYDGKALRRWHAFVNEQRWKRAHIFFKHEETGSGPAFAQRFAALDG